MNIKEIALWILRILNVVVPELLRMLGASMLGVNKNGKE